MSTGNGTRQKQSADPLRGRACGNTQLSLQTYKPTAYNQQSLLTCIFQDASSISFACLIFQCVSTILLACSDFLRMYQRFCLPAYIFYECINDFACLLGFLMNVSTVLLACLDFLRMYQRFCLPAWIFHECINDFACLL